MKPARLVLLLIALLAGGLAYFLATRGSTPETTVVTEVVEEKKTQILVAKAGIGVGQRLNAELVEWQDWPEGAVRSEYITVAGNPDAPAQLVGAVARFEFFAGEPIREQKLVRADQGYLSAVLPEGMRGVSINVSAASGAGGFIVPNDRVDVVLTRSGPTGQISETILSNVKVLAIGHRLGEMGTTGAVPEGEGPETQVFDGATIATLELSPAQAEIVINSATIGQLSLVLRSIVDFQAKAVTAGQGGTSQAIKTIKFGKEASIYSGETAPADRVDAAPQVPPQEPSSSIPVPAAELPPEPAAEVQ